MDDQNKNLILATALSFLVILVWFLLFPPEEPTPADVDATTTQSTQPEATVPGVAPGAAPGATANTTAIPTETDADVPRIAIETPRLSGSISLTGGRIDELYLEDYKVSLAEDAANVRLLSPAGQVNAFYAAFGWSHGAELGPEDVPNPETIWTASEGAVLTPDTPVTLTWTNGTGLTFARVVSIDEDYLFRVTQRVTNDTGAAVRLAPYGVLDRLGEPADLKGFFIIHEGAIRQTGETLDEVSYSNLRDQDFNQSWGGNTDVAEISGNGWIGFTDHYWMATLIPADNQAFNGAMTYFPNRDLFRTTAQLATLDVAPGETAEVEQKLFAGAKEWEAIRNYERELGIYRFIDSIDWGWFFFLTKPIFAGLHWLNAVIGNMGWAIIALTFIIKAFLLPLAYKSYVSMAKMKELQPEMEKIKERAGDDRQKLQTEMMSLYKKEKVNPAAGCLPILLQIPIFFSLYKVIFVTIELRHAPWVGWIRDLSAPDPSSIYNLWGIFPWAGPEPGSILALMFIGILPLILGISMWLQQKLNPAPTDPTQAMIFAWMPWVFMFMLGSFASGLVIYWIANNVITFGQQYLIMRSQGMKPDVFGNILTGFKKKSAEATEKPANKSGKPSGKK
ncbi:MAG: membrane protein insertase YidC [Pseudomonadota bacterium]